ncbi:metallopeptidase family protein [Winkia sp. UMB3158]|nr:MULTISPECIES: metallopeptidase family protein [Winkia]MDK7148649.1 metallopeptidase family protein [Winkia sp. UMB3158]PLB80900.1 peptidase [Actinomyces sp. UMB0138]MDK6240116.1 metallopeptidase family protein [Winkia sp. UMB10116]MDK8564603.1 metallopeptidase family protein [Winkia sp. UMB3164A]MDU6111031.1 metallopeptidase family protein [Winkia neuii]
MSICRDRHGRGRRGVLMPPTLPGSLTRSQFFDMLVIANARSIRKGFPSVADWEFAVEDVPPSDPAPWERQAPVLARTFTGRAGSGLKPRVVLYRIPLSVRASNRRDLAKIIRLALVDQIASALGIAPTDVDPGYDPNGF